MNNDLHIDKGNEAATAVDIHFMRAAIAEAQKAAALGEAPIGAVVVLNGEIIGAGYNRKELDQDPTAHAEMIALREAAVRVNNWRLIDAVMYCTLEPCPMCAGAMIQARLPRLVYGAPDLRFGVAETLMDLFSDSRFNHRVTVTAGVLADEAANLLRTFFRELRA